MSPLSKRDASQSKSCRPEWRDICLYIRNHAHYALPLLSIYKPQRFDTCTVACINRIYALHIIATTPRPPRIIYTTLSSVHLPPIVPNEPPMLNALTQKTSHACVCLKQIRQRCKRAGNVAANISKTFVQMRRRTPSCHAEPSAHECDSLKYRTSKRRLTKGR